MHNNFEPSRGRGFLADYLRSRVYIKPDETQVKKEGTEEYNLGAPELPHCVHQGITMVPPDGEEYEGTPITSVPTRKLKLPILKTKRYFEGNCEIYSTERLGISYTYITPTLSSVDGLNCLSTYLKELNLNALRIVIVCLHLNEAKQLKQELAYRSVATAILQADADGDVTQNLSKLWIGGYLNQALILSDDMLSSFDYDKVNYLIHYMLPSNEVFQHRFALTKGVPTNLQTVVLRSVNDKDKFLFREIGFTELSSKKPINKLPEKMPPLCQRTEKQVPAAKDEWSTQLTEERNIVSNSSQKSPQKKPVDKMPEQVPLACHQKIKQAPAKDKLSTQEIKRDGVFLNDLHCYLKYGAFVHSRVAQFPCYSIKNVPVERSIKEVMKKQGVERGYRIQRFAWPHTVKGRSLIVIGSQETGKTWSYLPILCQRTYEHMKNRQEKKEFDDDFGPCSVIIVSSVAKGQLIASRCLKLLDFCRLDVDVLVVQFERCNAREARTRMQQPCGILITTLPEFENLWHCHDKSPANDLFNELNVGCIAIDGIDEIWRNTGLKCNKVLQGLFTRFRFVEGQAQLFITARCWPEKVLHSALLNMPDFLLVIEDPLEVSVYGGIKLELQTINADEQLLDKGLFQMLQQTDLKQERIVIVCRDTTDAMALGANLQFNDIDHYIFDDTNDMIESILDWQKNRLAKVLITTDDAIKYLHCGPITRLIHYTMASSWSRFKARFNLFYEKFHTMSNTSIVSNQDINAAAAEICNLSASTIITVRKGDADSLWKFCDFMLRHEFDVPEMWLTALFNFKLDQDQELKFSHAPFCRQVAAFGTCFRRTCRFRHFVWDYECLPQSDYAPNSNIEFQIIGIYSPAQLAVRLAEYATETIFLGNPITKHGMERQLHYEQPNNRQQCKHVVVGDLCIMKHNERYERVAVINFESDIRVQVKILDGGTDFVMVTLRMLLICEERFKHQPFEARELRLTGLSPINMDRIWSNDSKRVVRNKYFEQFVGQIFKAEVDFAFYGTIFVSDVFNSKGESLKSFIKKNFLTCMDVQVEKRVLQIVAAAKVSGNKPKTDHRLMHLFVHPIKAAPNKQTPTDFEPKKELLINMESNNPTKMNTLGSAIDTDENCKTECWQECKTNELNVINDGVYKHAVKQGHVTLDPKSHPSRHPLKMQSANANVQDTEDRRPDSAFQELMAIVHKSMQSKEQLMNAEFLRALAVPQWSDTDTKPLPSSVALADLEEPGPEQLQEGHLQPRLDLLPEVAHLRESDLPGSEPLPRVSLPKKILTPLSQTESQSLVLGAEPKLPIQEPKPLSKILEETQPQPAKVLSEPLTQWESIQEPKPQSQPKVVEEDPKVVSKETQQLFKAQPKPLSRSQLLLEENKRHSLEPRETVSRAQCTRPTVTWYDTPAHVFVSIATVNVTKYELIVVKRVMSYIAPEAYKSFDINLFSAVVSFKHEMRGSKVVVKLTKPFCNPWPRLCREQYRMPWIHFDLSKLNVPHDACDLILHQTQNSKPDSEGDTEPDIDSDENEEYDVYEDDIKKHHFAYNS